MSSGEGGWEGRVCSKQLVFMLSASSLQMLHFISCVVVLLLQMDVLRCSRSPGKSKRKHFCSHVVLQAAPLGLPEPKMSSAAWIDLPALKTSNPALKTSNPAQKTSNPAQFVSTEANVIMSMVFTAS